MPLGSNMPGAGAISDTLTNIMDAKIAGIPRALDFGVINADGSLTCNAYRVPIPKGSYLVCRGVALPNSEVIDSHETQAENNYHAHVFEDGAALEGATDVQGTVDPHEHTVIVPMGELKTKTARSSQKSHLHPVDIARPSQRCLQPGDRVLVAWVTNDAVVIDIIVSAASVLR